MSNDELIQIDFETIKHETPAAWLLAIDGQYTWFPKSNCLMDDDPKINAIHVPEWLANAKGLV